MKSKPSSCENSGQAAPYDVPNGSALVKIVAIVGLRCGARDDDARLGLDVGGDGKCLNDLGSEIENCEGD